MDNTDLRMNSTMILKDGLINSNTLDKSDENTTRIGSASTSSGFILNNSVDGATHLSHPPPAIKASLSSKISNDNSGNHLHNSVPVVVTGSGVVGGGKRSRYVYTI